MIIKSNVTGLAFMSLWLPPSFRAEVQACGGRVLRFDSSSAAEGSGLPLRGNEFVIPLCGMKTVQPGCARWKCTPIPAARYFHPEGEVCSPLSICPHKQRKA